MRELTPTGDGLAADRRRRPATPSWSTWTRWCWRVPARPAARLLAGAAGGRRRGVGGLDYASVALVTLALPAAGAARAVRLPGAGRPRALLIKAATFFTTKWGHLRRPDGSALVRASVGRYGEEAPLQRPDDGPGGHRAPGAVGECSARRCPRRWTGTCSAGAARCRSTPPGTPTGWPRPGRRCGPRTPRWRWPAPATTASASRSASAPARRRPRRSSQALGGSGEA